MRQIYKNRGPPPATVFKSIRCPSYQNYFRTPPTTLCTTFVIMSPVLGLRGVLSVLATLLLVLLNSTPTNAVPMAVAVAEADMSHQSFEYRRRLVEIQEQKARTSHDLCVSPRMKKSCEDRCVRNREGSQVSPCSTSSPLLTEDTTNLSAYQNTIATNCDVNLTSV